ncbi:MAG: ATP-binding protein [Thiovulaceae bacterium]|nr:ATP-binding protein [Sulfurimonadaceae bacterium]
MRNIIGKYNDALGSLELKERNLYYNTLILGEHGAGKTNLACRIRDFVIDSNVPTFYIDFSDSNEEDIEMRYKDQNFNYIRYEETQEFEEALQVLIDAKKHIYMSASPSYFDTSKRHVKSKLTKTIQNKELLNNYYYFLHDIENLNGFYVEFADFLLYMLSFSKLAKYGLTFLAQPHKTFENAHIKLMFTYLFIGKCSNIDYYNTASLKNLVKNRFLYQFRTENPTLLFNDIKTHSVDIKENVIEE